MLEKYNYLFYEFEGACKQVDVKNAIEHYELLVNLYNQKPREYHSMVHMEFFSYIQKLNLYNEVNSPTFILKKWFHDAIYNPKSNDNEFKSKKLWEQIAKTEGVNALIIDDVSKGIDATTYGTYFPNTFEDKVFCDTDLSVLGQSFGSYAHASANVRKEYAHLDDASFINGRLKVIDSFLSLAQIYATPNYQERFEKSARDNLQKEKNLLLQNKILI